MPGPGHPLCRECTDRLPPTSFHLLSGNPVEKIFWGRMNIQQASATYYFTKESLVQHLIHQIKYKGRKDLGLYFGEIMGRTLLLHPGYVKMDAIIPVPMHKSKEKSRGYNQANLLATGIGKILRLPVIHDNLVRTQGTGSQTHKGRIERWQKMAENFLVKDPALLENLHLLLVDDILTTGATFEASGSRLTEINGVKLSIAALAFTEP